MARKKRRRQRGRGIAGYARRKMGFHAGESLKKQVAKKHLLPMLYRNRKLRNGKTIGGVKFKVKKYDKHFLNTMTALPYPFNHRFKKDVYTVQASKKILGKTFRRNIL